MDGWGDPQPTLTARGLISCQEKKILVNVNQQMEKRTSCSTVGLDTGCADAKEKI